MNVPVQNHQPLLKSLCAVAASLVLAGTVAPAIAADDGVFVTAHALPEAAYMALIGDQLEQGMRRAPGASDGTVAMWFVVSHGGQLIAKGVEQSSGSVALDQQARRIVTRAHYAAMPDETWARGGDRRYVARMRFEAGDAGDRVELGAQ